MNAAIVVMAKAPVPGRVKTRLRGLLTPQCAAQLHAVMLASTLATARDVAPTYLALDGDWPSPVPTFAQCGGDLGRRMSHAAATVGARGHDRVVVIGTDVPGLEGGRLTHALLTLDEHRCVVGPAADGGYYLIGGHPPLDAVFAIDPQLWGGPGVFAATLTTLAAAGRAVAVLEPLRDLDTPADARSFLDDPATPARVRALLASDLPTAS